MSFSNDNLKPGMIVDNGQLQQIFGCSPQGGMRRAHKTKTLVLVSNHIKSIYDDRWVDDIFHYTGMGTNGDQSLDFSQNKTLTHSPHLDIGVHLFEVFIDKKYTYIGEVKLQDTPYFEQQPDEKGVIRQACVFPLTLKQTNRPPLPFEDLSSVINTKAKKARRLSDKEVELRAKSARKKAGVRTTTSQYYERDPWVAEHAKRKALGICQLCEEPGPFKDKQNRWYLETHHIVWLSQGGDDTVENTVALCPNCHKKMHIINDSKDIKKLKAHQ